MAWRESAHSWRDLLLDLKRRGLAAAPVNGGEIPGQRGGAKPGQ